jgi:dolichol-phosphate mannosyltransferase
VELLETRAGRALRKPENWLQLLKFCVVGASGYAVNLGVYVALLRGAGLHYLPSAACSFVVAVSNNYFWNRHWTFRGQRGHVYYQGIRFLLVSLVALGANLLVLRGLVALGAGKILGQAIAIILVTPLNFVGNKLWSFRHG